LSLCLFLFGDKSVISFVSMSDPQRSQRRVRTPLAFAKLIAVERVPDAETKAQAYSDVKVEVFQSISRPWAPTLAKNAFGGHVCAQSAYAASKTVPEGLVIHVSCS
jgi:hypothetical protein